MPPLRDLRRSVAEIAFSPESDSKGNAVSRLACVDVPALPLQILLRRHPEWRSEPVAVVAEDKVRTRICWANRRAITLGVRPGMQQAAAVACCPTLRVDHVRASEIEREVRRLAERLHRWSPQVEMASSPSPHGLHGLQLSGFGAAGTFWLRASGLAGLFGPLSDWIDALSKDLREDGFRVSIAVGFNRFDTFAAARATFGLQIFESPAEEKTSALRAPLVRFGLPEKTLAGLAKLGVSSLRDLLRLAEEGRSGKGLANRFGKEVQQLHRLASGESSTPISEAFRRETPVEHWISFEPPETDTERLIFHAKRLLDQILDDLGEKGLAVIELAYRVECEDAPPIAGSLRPALPSEDGVKLLSLLRLRLGAISPENRTAVRQEMPPGPDEPARRISGLVLRALGGVHVVEQPGLYQNPGEALSPNPKKIQKKASEALAQIQAEFGEDSLVRLETRDAHLPRGRYRCRPISPGEATVRIFSGKSVPDFFETRTPRLIRRIYDQPLILPHRGSGEPDGWLLRGIEHGPVQSFTGPFRISGGWWRLLSGRPVSRDYFFVRLKRGDVCWVFFDRERRSWFLEGRVE